MYNPRTILSSSYVFSMIVVLVSCVCGTASTSSGALPPYSANPSSSFRKISNRSIFKAVPVIQPIVSLTSGVGPLTVSGLMVDNGSQLSFSAPARSHVAISVTPANGTTNGTKWNAEYVFPGSVRSFFSQVKGSTNVLADWTSSCGSPASTLGVTYFDWTAPDMAGTCTIVASPQADHTQVASSTVTVLPESISVKVMPFYLVLYKNQYADLQSYVSSTATAYADVRWTITGPSQGAVNGSMVDRDLAWSSAMAGSYTITATSTRDNTKSGSATVIVTNDAMPSITANGTQPVDCTCVGSGRCVDIGGNGSSYHTIASWFSAGNTLALGDTLRIWNKGSAYHEQLIIDGIYSATKPVRVCGVPDVNGNLPEINGANAIAANPKNPSWGSTQYGLQQYAIWTIHNANYYAAPPQYILIEGLKINQAQGVDRYTLRNTSTNYYYGTTSGTHNTGNTGASCLRVQNGEDIVIRGNELATCGQWGFFTNAQTPEGKMVRRVTFEGNYLHDNATPGNYSMHNTYIQSDGAVIQFNYFGHATPGALGSNLKTRSAGIYVRYNHLLAEQRITDFVEPQDSGPYFYTYIWKEQTSPDPNDNTTLASIASTEEHLWNVYAYGNTLWTGDGYCQNCVHYGWDMLPNQAQGGTLWFYHNTFQAAFSSSVYGWALWDAGNPSGSTGATTFSHSQLINNVIFRDPTPVKNRSTLFSWARSTGDFSTLGKNWINSTWATENANPGYGHNCISATTATSWQNVSGLCSVTYVDMSHSVQTGAPMIDATTYIPSSSSGVRGNAGALHPQVARLPPKFVFYPATKRIVLRTTVTDLGAIPYMSLK